MLPVQNQTKTNQRAPKKLCYPAFQEASVHHLDCVVRTGPLDAAFDGLDLPCIPGYQFWMVAVAVIDLKIGAQVVRATDVHWRLPQVDAWGPLKALIIEFELLDPQGCALAKGLDAGGEYFETGRGKVKLLDGPAPWIKWLCLETASNALTLTIGNKDPNTGQVITLAPKDALCCEREQAAPNIIVRAKVTIDQQRAKALQCNPCVDTCDALVQQLTMLGSSRARSLARQMFSFGLEPARAGLYNFHAFRANSESLPHCQDSAEEILNGIDTDRIVEKILTRHGNTAVWEHLAECFPTNAIPNDATTQAVCRLVLEKVKSSLAYAVLYELVAINDEAFLAAANAPSNASVYAVVANCLDIIGKYLNKQLDSEYVFANYLGKASHSGKNKD